MPISTGIKLQEDEVQEILYKYRWVSSLKEIEEHEQLHYHDSCWTPFDDCGSMILIGSRGAPSRAKPLRHRKGLSGLHQQHQNSRIRPPESHGTNGRKRPVFATCGCGYRVRRNSFPLTTSEQASHDSLLRPLENTSIPLISRNADVPHEQLGHSEQTACQFPVRAPIYLNISEGSLSEERPTSLLQPCFRTSRLHAHSPLTRKVVGVSYTPDKDCEIFYKDTPLKLKTHSRISCSFSTLQSVPRILRPRSKRPPRYPNPFKRAVTPGRSDHLNICKAGCSSRQIDVHSRHQLTTNVVAPSSLGYRTVDHMPPKHTDEQTSDMMKGEYYTVRTTTEDLRLRNVAGLWNPHEAYDILGLDVDIHKVTEEEVKSNYILAVMDGEKVSDEEASDRARLLQHLTNVEFDKSNT